MVSFLHLNHRLSPQGSDLPKPFQKSILAHTATVLSFNTALIITSIKPINPSYFTIVYAHPGSPTCIGFQISVVHPICELYGAPKSGSVSLNGIGDKIGI